MVKSGFGAVLAMAALFMTPAAAQTPATEDHPPPPTLAVPAVQAEDHPAVVLPDAAVPDAAVPTQAEKGVEPDADTPAPTQTATPDQTEPQTPEPQKTAEVPPAMLEPVTLQHPTVVDTARLAGEGQEVPLFGVVGLQGQFAQDLHGAIAGEGDQVTCQAQSASDYTCLLPDGTDVAALALRNGAAQTRDDAPDAYREFETAARDERRGVWSSLPPPPSQVQHPVVVDTGTLAAGGQTFPLFGIQGLGMPYARDLLGYIEANGDSLMCDPQGDTGRYVCLLPDGTDLAKVALVNGAARVAVDAPDSYRIEQGDALANRRGFWRTASPDVLVAVSSTPPPVTPQYVLVPGDDGADGVTYVGGAPAVVVGGAMVFLAYGGAAGWGYWDGGHHWHGAPPQQAAHMEHYHPGGAGLHGSGGAGGGGGPRGGMHTAAAGGTVPVHPQQGGQQGGQPGGFVHPGVTPAVSHPMPAVVHPTPAAARPTPGVARPPPTPVPAAAHAPMPAAGHAPMPAAAHAPAPAPIRAPAPAPHPAPAAPKSCGKPHC